MHYNHFSSVNLTVLPPSLQVLTLFGNQLVGQSVGLQLDALPRGMKELDLAWNAELQGPLNLTALPPTMSVLNLYGNKFGGRLDLGHLPLNLTWLALEANHGAPRFCGEGDVSPPQVCRSIFLGGACHVNCVNASFNCGIC
jgi:hypothetical protein